MALAQFAAFLNTVSSKNKCSFSAPNHSNSHLMLSNKTLKFSAAILLILIGIFYCFQLVSPLRINTDAYRLLSMAVSASEDKGYLVDGCTDQFPIGYPFLVRMLLMAGIGDSGSLAALNLLFYAVGLCVLWVWSRSLADRSLSLIVVLWVVSSWVLIKHASIPLTEAGYFGLSLAALYCLKNFLNFPLKNAWKWFIASIFLIYLSLQFRTTGITLLPTAAVTAILHPGFHPFWINFGIYRSKIIATLALVFIVSCAILIFIIQNDWFVSQFLAKGSYFKSMLGYFDRLGALGVFNQNLEFRVREMGEIVLNFPENKALILRPAYYLAGSAGWALIAAGSIWLWRRKFFPIVAYLIFYLVLMMMWPSYDARFWIPLLPIFSLAVWGWLSELTPNRKLIRFGCLAVMGCHILIGLVALSFSTRISFSGKNMSEYFGEKSTQMTYREAFRNGLPVEAELVHPGKVRILQVFEPMAKQNLLK